MLNFEGSKEEEEDSASELKRWASKNNDSESRQSKTIANIHIFI